MQKFAKAWLSCWLYIICGIGGALIGILVFNWMSWTWVARLQVLAILSLILHVMEEWRFPGGFYHEINLARCPESPETSDRYPMNQLTDMFTNLIPILFGCVMIALGSPIIGSMMWFYLCLSDSLGHLHMGVNLKKKYASQGKRTIYNPGLISSLCCFIPVFCTYVWSFIFVQAPTILEWVLSLAFVIVMHIICLKVPEKILMSKTSLYPYDWGRGYFSKYE